MNGHEKIVRALKILLRLSNGRWHSLSELAEDIEHGERTVERYIADFREVGFSVVVKDGLYRIPTLDNKLKDLKEMLYFTNEEAMVMNKAICSIDDNNILKEGLVQKLTELYDFDQHIDIKDHPVHSKNIENLNTAISNKEQVVLQQYRSSNGQMVRDRLVEPFSFTADYNTVWVYEPESQLCKVFKTSRIGSVKLIGKAFQFAHLHKKLPTDVFRMTGESTQNVKLKLNLRAYNLLIEEYPQAEMYLKPLKNDFWQFEAPIANFAGVGRFCMGLCEDVEIQRPKELKEFIFEKIKNKYKF